MTSREITEITCRYCLTSDLNNIIAPCLCSGTAKYVHKNCLFTWLKSRRNNYIFPIIPNNIFKCEICNYNYNILFNQTRICNQDITMKLIDEYIKTFFVLLSTTLILTLMFSPLQLFYKFINKNGIVYDYINLFILNQLVLGSIWLMIIILAPSVPRKWFLKLSNDNILLYILYIIMGFGLWMFYDVTAKILDRQTVIVDILDREIDENI